MLRLSDFHNEKLQSLEPIRLTEKLPQVGSHKTEFRFDFMRGIFMLREPITEPIDYIINDKFEFLLGKGHYKLNKKKETLISAGRVIVDKKISYIDNDSGHYSPSKNHLEAMIVIFRELDLLSADFTSRNYSI